MAKLVTRADERALTADYTPLELEPYANAGPEILGPSAMPLGSQTFHGLPFLIGDTDGGKRCFLVLGPGDAPVSIGVGKRARYLIFAHRQLDSQLFAGGPMAELVAEYVVRYADGAELRLPIRERLEIAVIAYQGGQYNWGQWPLLAWPDRKDALYPRYQGDWGLAGQRQTESMQGTARAYYLWPWANPRPDELIESLTVVPGRQRLLLAAVTLGSADESPFFREGRRELKITLPQAEDARRPFALEVEVDRGVATYPHALPLSGPSEFLGDDMRGWGEARNFSSSPAYVEIAATPSATVEVKLGEETLGSVHWGDLTAQSVLEPASRLRVELIDNGRNWVRTTVVDDATGRPLNCRIHFRSPEGVPYAPHGHHAHINSGNQTWHVDIGGDVRLGQISYAYIDGNCEGWLPRGDVMVDVARGFEYEPLRTTVHIAPGQQELQLRLKRWIDMRQRRYFSGDTHVHFLSTQGAQLEASGEGLNVVNLLLSQWGSLFTNTEEFTGAPNVSPDGGTIVYATQENRQHMLGHLTLLGLKRQVRPWCTDGPSEADLGGSLETTMSAWADACHAQGGTVVIPHLPTPNGEPAALIATGRADAVEILRHRTYEHLEYYRYLNGGYRLPLVGGTDKMSSDVPVGLYRTYVHIPPEEAFTYDNWCRYLRQGRTVLSGGPIIHLSVDGHAVGDTVNLPGNGGTVEVTAWAESTLPIHSLQIVRQGRVVAATEQRGGARRLELRERLHIDRHTWLAARCGGPNYSDQEAVAHHDVWNRHVMAHTSPIYVAVGEPWWLFDPDTARYMLALLDGSLAYIRQRSVQYPAATTTHHHGQEDHTRYLEGPFREAIAALHRRMHERGIAH